jgi:hypothetical protein
VRPYVSLATAFLGILLFAASIILFWKTQWNIWNTSAENFHLLCELKAPEAHLSYVLHLSKTPRMFLLINLQIYQTL